MSAIEAETTTTNETRPTAICPAMIRAIAPLAGRDTFRLVVASDMPGYPMSAMAVVQSLA